MDLMSIAKPLMVKTQAKELRCVFEPSRLTLESPMRGLHRISVPPIISGVRGLARGGLAWCAVGGLRLYCLWRW